MPTPTRMVSKAVVRFVALAAAALAHGALADEGGPGGADPAVPSYLDAARLLQVEEAYRARAARSDGAGELRNTEASAPPAKAEEEARAAVTAAEPPRKIERARRLAATVRERVERFGLLVRSDAPGDPLPDRTPPDAAGWAMHADDARLEEPGASGKELEARLEAAERRAAEAEARLKAEAAARRRAEKAAESAQKPAEPPRPSRQGKREQAERRDDEAPKPARESRRGTRSQADREPAASRRDGDKRAAAAEPARPRSQKARAPQPPPVEMESPPPPPRASGLFGLFAPSAPEPPPPQSGRPDIPNEFRSRGWY